MLDLIKFTKQYPLQLSDCNFNQTITKGIKSCEYVLKNKNIKIQFKPDKNIPVAQLDAARMEEICANLITHSLDNLPDHMGSVRRLPFECARFFRGRTENPCRNSR